MINGAGIIKSNQDALSASNTLYAVHTDLTDEDKISKYYEESSYSKLLPIESAAIPAHMLGEEIKELFNFSGQTNAPLLSTLIEIDRSYYNDYKWQIVSFNNKVECI